MNQSPEVHRCTLCARAYKIRDHGDLDRRAVPGSPELAKLYAEAVLKCPYCIGKHKVSEAEAVAAAIRIGDKMRQEFSAPYFYYAKRIGIFVAALALVFLLLIRWYAQLRGDTYDPTPLMVVLTLVLIGGIGVSVWAHVKSGREPHG